jgi:PKD repeat protein
VWQYRLVVRASATARGAVTSTRTLTASGRTNPPDTTAPAAVTAVSATAATDSSIRLSWVNPSDVDFTGVTIRRQIGAVAPATVTDGTPVAVPASATAISFTDTGLSPLTLYSYALFAHDGSANYSAAATVIGWTTGTPPGPTTAVLSISPPSGAATTKLTVGSPFVFDASLSYAGTGRSFSAGTLDYGDGTASESFTGDSWNWVRNHSYATTGPRTVTLTVTDSAGDIASNVVAITVYSTPTAHLVAQGRPQVGTPVTFDLTSTTPAGTGLTSYSLNVLGVDGTTRYGANGSPLATKEITFTTPGTYEVQFSVSNDAGGSSAIDSVTIDVAGSRTTPVLSVASYGVDTTTITAGGSLFFVATDTYAGPGVTLSSVVLTYGDNTAQMVFTGNQAYWFENHTYDNAGTYPVTLTVTDSSNVTVTKVVTVTVAPAPTAAITIDPNQSSVRVGVPVTFTLTPSTPVGTAITSWTVGGDWWDGGYGTPPPSTLTHTFNTPGTYTVQFEFSNDAQGTAHASIPITVVP